jgi:hypothetical protein
MKFEKAKFPIWLRAEQAKLNEFAERAASLGLREAAAATVSRGGLGELPWPAAGPLRRSEFRFRVRVRVRVGVRDLGLGFGTWCQLVGLGSGLGFIELGG